MSRFNFILILLVLVSSVKGQVVHKIKADSVLLTNPLGNAELNLENNTSDIKGFLYNKGNGRTEFRKFRKLNDTVLVVGDDTIFIKRAKPNWKLAGSANTNPSTDFIGTKDSQALVIRTNNQPRARIAASGNLLLPGSTSIDTVAKLSTGGNLGLKGNVLDMNNATLGGIDNKILFYSGGNLYGKIGSSGVATFLGVGAGRNNDTIYGGSSTAMGYNALANIITGSQNNTAFGAYALRSLTNAYGNTVMGYNAGISIVTGGRNTLIGAGAGANLATNQDNTVVGATALRNPDMTVTTGLGPIGNFNTMLGYNAGGNNSLGGVWTISSTYTNVIMIGNSTGKETLGGTLTNTTLIGHNLMTNLSNILVLGNAGQSIILPNTDTVTTDSGAKLQINAAAGYQLLQIRKPYTPTSSADANGRAGSIAWDENYIYFKTATGWVRSALSTF